MGEGVACSSWAQVLPTVSFNYFIWAVPYVRHDWHIVDILYWCVYNNTPSKDVSALGPSLRT